MRQMDAMMKHQARKLFPPELHHSTPSLVAKPAAQPKELTRELLSTLKFREMDYWLRKYHLPISSTKKARFNNLSKFLDRKEKEK